MFTLLLSLLSFSLFPSLITAYSDPQPCSGSCWTHDPTVVQRTSDGQYYRFATNGYVEISSASSLSGPWSIKGYALPSGSSISNPGNKDIWAPDVHKVGSTYYMYYAVSSWGTQNSAIGLATSSSLDPGTWTDHGSIGVSSSTANIYNTIDPNLILVGSQYYLNFGSFWDDIYQVAMNNPPTKAASGSKPYNLAFNSSGTHAEEGSYMFNYGGYYYLLWSEGICCGYATTKPKQGEEYRINMCRSSSATGGFVDKNGKACISGGGSTLLASHGWVYGPGGQGVLMDSSLGPVLYYHYADTRGAIDDGHYKFGWNQLKWSGGWPYV